MALRERAACLDFELAPRPVHFAGRVDDCLADCDLIEHGQLHSDLGEVVGFGVHI